MGSNNQWNNNNGQQGSKLPFLSILKFLYWWSKENHSIKFCLRQINMALDTIINFEIKIASANKWTRIVYQKSTLTFDNLTILFF